MESEAAKATPASAAISRKSAPATSRPKPKRHLSLENRVLLLALVAGVGGLTLALVLLWTGNHDFNTQLSLTILLLAMWFGFADRKSTRLNSSHRTISYAVFCLKKKKKNR